MKQFSRWLFRKRKVLTADTLAGVDLPSQDATKKRRALTADELARLIQTAAESPHAFRELSGPDRAVLYSLAVTTGFRASELAALTASSFDLAADPPAVSLPGAHTKNRKVARLPSGPLWPGSWWEKAADMIRADLLAAGVAGVTEEGESVFHSLRHTFVTLVGQTAPLKVLQELARHSTPILTVGRYFHAGLSEKAAAVDAIPLGGKNADPFARLSRPELEALAAAALTTLATILDTPDVATATDGAGRRETPAGKKRRNRSPKKD